MTRPKAPTAVRCPGFDELFQSLGGEPDQVAGRHDGHQGEPGPPPLPERPAGEIAPQPGGMARSMGAGPCVGLTMAVSVARVRPGFGAGRIDNIRCCHRVSSLSKRTLVGGFKNHAVAALRPGVTRLRWAATLP